MGIPVISVARMREWEGETWAGGQTEAEVIRQVGKAVAARALRMTRPGQRILLLAGKGNNGEDVRLSQPHLADRVVDLLDVREPAPHMPLLEGALAKKPVLIVDGLFGIGLDRDLDASWCALVERVNSQGTRVLAVDVPSGLNAETGAPMGTAIRADVTLTVGAVKSGLLRQSAWEYVGRLEVARDIGLAQLNAASDIIWSGPEDFDNYPPRRPVAAHKGQYGHLAILAGSMGYHGAAVLASRGAQRARAGLISLQTLETVYHPIASQCQGVMVHPWAPAIKVPTPFDAYLVGPGLAAKDLPEQVKRMVRFAWRDVVQPLIVDASALDWVPLEAPPAKALRVLTPHPGEAARLLRWGVSQVQADRPGAVRALSKRFGNCWVVLKGYQTVIGRSTGELRVNGTGNAGLAQGGSGDLLAGFIAGMLAQPALQTDPGRALSCAVFEHGAAADRLEQQQQNWTVEDLAAELGKFSLF